MDLRRYLSQYTGHGTIYRALFIAENSPKNGPQRLEAYRYVVEKLRQSTNTILYKKICTTCYAEYPLEEFKCDELWVNQTEASTRVQTDKYNNPPPMLLYGPSKSGSSFAFSSLSKH